MADEKQAENDSVKIDPEAVTLEIPLPAPPPPDPLKLYSGLLRLLKSSKALVALGAIVVVAVLTYIGKVSVDDALGFFQWIVLGFIGAVAVEDGAAHLSPRGGGISSGRLGWLMQALMPFLGKVVDGMSKPPTGPVPAGMVPMPGSPPAEPQKVVPISSQLANVLMNIAQTEGAEPGPFIEEFVGAAIEAKSKEWVAKAAGAPRPAPKPAPRPKQ